MTSLRWIGLGVAACLLSLVALRSDSLAQAPATDSEIAYQLGQAMRARIAVSYNQRSGKTIPAYHCRHAPEGCESRLSTFAQYLVEAGTQTASTLG